MEPAVTPVFTSGARVRVLRDAPAGHCRTPHYIRGRTGRVVMCYGAFRNPEGLAYFRDGLPKQPLYHVEFDQADVWPNYAGGRADKVRADLYQHWLEPA